jgi:2-polyprenyl-3-methyl-5-hydroxy-6-metoxy-1,4-benzoquinol methylase
MRADWREVQRRFYDSTADQYRENFQQVNAYFDFVTARLLAAVAPRPGERVLELGASGGRFTVPLLERGCRVTAVDISPRSIEYLDRLLTGHPRRSELTLVVDDASTLGRVTARDFDAVVGAHILHHVQDLDGLLVRARERLRPGGRAVFLEPNPWNPLWYVQVTLHPRRRWRVERGLLRVWPGRVRRQLLAAGFTQARTATFGCFPPFVLNLLPGASGVETALERVAPLARLFTLNLFSATRP